MKYWLFKAEPEDDYSYSDLERDGAEPWTGVRNYQARNNMQAMRVGDLGFFYHSQKERRIVGVVKVSKEAFPDPTTDDERWHCVEVQPVKALNKPVTLAMVKADSRLADIPLVRQSRLSVQPVPEAAWHLILELGETTLDD